VDNDIFVQPKVSDVEIYDNEDEKPQIVDVELDREEDRKLFEERLKYSREKNGTRWVEVNQNSKGSKLKGISLNFNDNLGKGKIEKGTVENMNEIRQNSNSQNGSDLDNIPRKIKEEDLDDIPRKSNNDLDMIPRKSKGNDLDNIPRKIKEEDLDDIPRKLNDDLDNIPRKNNMMSGERSGLYTSDDIQREEEEKERKRIIEFSKMNPKDLGKDSETIYRDRRGRKLTMLNEIVRQQNGQFVNDEETYMEWGVGKVDKKEKRKKRRKKKK